jgi:hypothetical protein
MELHGIFYGMPRKLRAKLLMEAKKNNALARVVRKPSEFLYQLRE